MTRPHVPQSVLDAAHARKAARLGRDWAEADRLKGEIRSAGWLVVDHGVDFSLQPAHPGDVDDGWRIRHGSSASVPSRLPEPDTAALSLVVCLDDGSMADADDVRTFEAWMARLRASSAGVPVVLVAGDPPEAAAQAIRAIAAADPAVEVVWTNGRIGPGAARNSGLRRSTGALVVVVGPQVAMDPAVLTALTTALALPGIAAAGGLGLRGPDLLHLASAGPGPAVAFDGSCMAVRRRDAARTPVDERYLTWRGAAVAWTLALRDGGPGQAPRRAMAVPLPSAEQTRSARDQHERERDDRRDRYRLADDFGGRPDLLDPGDDG